MSRSSGEAVLTKTSALGLMMASVGKDLGLSVGVTVEGKLRDSPMGVGRQKHVHARYLWLQERVANKEIQVKKIPTRDNEAEVLTKL
eukprot:338155-Amphidinium_carterae.1